MLRRVKSVSLALALAFAALGLPAALWAQPPEIPAPMTLMVQGIDSDETVNEQTDLGNRWELMAVRSARGAPMGGVANAPTAPDFDGTGDGQLTLGEFPAARADHRQPPIPLQ